MSNLDRQRTATTIAVYVMLIKFLFDNQLDTRSLNHDLSTNVVRWGQHEIRSQQIFEVWYRLSTLSQLLKGLLVSMHNEAN